MKATPHHTLADAKNSNANMRSHGKFTDTQSAEEYTSDDLSIWVSEKNSWPLKEYILKPVLESELEEHEDWGRLGLSKVAETSIELVGIVKGVPLAVYHNVNRKAIDMRRLFGELYLET